MMMKQPEIIGCEVLEYEEFEVSADQAKKLFLDYTDQDKFVIDRMSKGKLTAFESPFEGYTICFNQEDFKIFGSSYDGETPAEYCARIFGVEGTSVSDEQNERRELYSRMFTKEHAERYSTFFPPSKNFVELVEASITPFSKKSVRLAQPLEETVSAKKVKEKDEDEDEDTEMQ